MKENHRIITLDALRGFAILGIPLMNVQSFAMIGQAYLNPTAFGDLTGVNLWTWIVSHCLADQKFMSLFSILFGASILLIASSSERKNGSSISIHYRRNSWLLVFGLLHAYLVWYGDILVPYACCAFLVYPLRKLPVNILFSSGFILFSIASTIEIYHGMELLHTPQEVLERFSGGWQPNQSIMEHEIQAYQGSFMDQLIQRSKTAKMLQTTYFLQHNLWRILGLMLLGIAFFKSGFLSGKYEAKLYKKIGVCVGIPSLFLVAVGILFNFHHHWSIEYSMYIGGQFNYWGSLGMALGYICIIICICKSKLYPHMVNKLSAVGRMALSNYLLQSALLALIFYGFGEFGKVERIYQLLIVAMLCLLQWWYSSLWLNHFYYGPMEWIWRSLTAKRLQAFKKSPK